MIALPLVIALLAQDASSEAVRQAAPPKLALCTQCHGSDGRSRSPAAPHIGGQNELYLVWALNQYREGRREGDVMSAVIDELSRKDIEELARWYAQQRWPATIPPEPEP
jgi:cytochrome c553